MQCSTYDTIQSNGTQLAWIPVDVEGAWRSGSFTLELMVLIPAPQGWFGTKIRFGNVVATGPFNQPEKKLRAY